jgi:L-alanine-DL-glutamate epimerase-like enolase superfamily enzyme
MKIVDVTVESYRAPIDPPIRNGRYTYATHDLSLVSVLTDEGVTGYGLGDGGVGLASAATMTRGTVESLRPALLGRDPLRTEQIWPELWLPKLLGRRGFTTRVVSAIDLALWDLKGKALGLSIARLLGQCHDSLPVYLAGGYYQEGKGIRELVAEMESFLEHGVDAVKMKIGGASLREDVERVSAVRAAVGEDVKLMVDANNAYSQHEAVALARRLESLGIYWLEEPLMPDDYAGHARLAALTSIPIAAGECEYTRYGFRDLIEHGSASILNPDVQFVGGVTEYMKVAALAQAHDLPLAPHGLPELHVHVAAAAPNSLIVEYVQVVEDSLLSRLFPHRLEIADGRVAPPDEPGFGIEPDLAALAPWRVA